MQQGGGEYLVGFFVYVFVAILVSVSFLFLFGLLCLPFFNKLLRQDAKFIFKLLTALSFSYWCAHLPTALSFSESSARPQVTSVNLQGACGWFPSALNPSCLQKNASLCPALGCSLSPIHVGLWVTTHRVCKGTPQLQSWAVQTVWRPTGHSP